MYLLRVVSNISILILISMHCELYLLSSAALTVDNVLKALKEVEWTKFYGNTVVRGDGVLQLPPSQWRKIGGKYAGETERKREGVKNWLWNHPYASWRLIIIRLDWMKEHAVADQIRGYAEKLTGMLGSSTINTS